MIRQATYGVRNEGRYGPTVELRLSLTGHPLVFLPEDFQHHSTYTDFSRNARNRLRARQLGNETNCLSWARANALLTLLFLRARAALTGKIATPRATRDHPSNHIHDSAAGRGGRWCRGGGWVWG
jgi:hypothetical protein